MSFDSVQISLGFTLLYIYRSQTQLNRTGKQDDGTDEGDGEEKAMIT